MAGGVFLNVMANTRILNEFYIGALFRHQIYNCDPHPGNYLFLDHGRICMLDHRSPFILA